MAEAVLTFEGQQYAMDSLSSVAQALCQRVQFCDQKLQQLRAEIAVFELARDVSVHALRSELPVVAAPAAAESVPAEPVAKKKTTRRKVH